MNEFKNVKSLENIDRIINSYKRFATISIIGCIIGLSVCVYVIYLYMQNSAAQVYVTRDFRVEKLIDKKAQIKAHSEMFYKLFFEIDQFNFKSRTDMALYLIGESGKKLRNTYAEKNWYNQIIQNNVVITVDIDSVKINEAVYPYEVDVIATMNIRRESAISKRYINSHFQVRDVNNSQENPFGLLIEQFSVTNNYEIPDKQ